MVTVKTKFIFSESAIAAKIDKNIALVQKKLDAQVLKDSNFYVPVDTSTLAKSGIEHTKLGSGRVSWVTPYARRQYYIEYSHDKQRNPNACNKWFEAAKARRLKTWEKIINDEYKRNS